MIYKIYLVLKIICSNEIFLYVFAEIFIEKIEFYLKILFQIINNISLLKLEIHTYLVEIFI